MFGIIYKITNTVNSKAYIGLTTMTLKERYTCHISESRSKRKHPLYNAIRKHGEDKFKVEQIDTAEDQYTLEEKEIHYINNYNSVIPNGYNLTHGGTGYVKQSDYTKKKKSNSQKKRFKDNPKEIERIQVGLKEYWLKRDPVALKERSDKIKAAWTPEQRQNVSKLHKGNKYAAGNTINRFAVKAINIQSGLESIFESCTAASIELNISGSSISRCVTNGKICKGYRFIKL